MSLKQNTPAAVQARERRAKALSLRLQEYTYDQIARALGLTRQRVHQLVQKARQDRQRAQPTNE